MRTIAAEVADSITMIEEEAVARFYDHVGLGAEYRGAETVGETRRIIREFKDAGYKVSQLETEAENTIIMLLSHDGVIMAWQYITMNIYISPMGGV